MKSLKRCRFLLLLVVDSFVDFFGAVYMSVKVYSLLKSFSVKGILSVSHRFNRNISSVSLMIRELPDLFQTFSSREG